MKAGDRATWAASGARAGDPHGSHLQPKWPSVPSYLLGHPSPVPRSLPVSESIWGVLLRERSRLFGDEDPRIFSMPIK